MITTRKYIETLAHSLAGGTNTAGAPAITVEEGEKWQVDIKERKLTYKIEDLKNYPYLVTRGLLCHEIGHLKYTTETPASELEQAHPEALHLVYNALEDIRIENELINEYGDFSAEGLANVYTYIGAENRRGQKDGELKDRPLYELLAGVMFIATRDKQLTRFNGNLSDISHNFIRNMPDHLRDKLQELRNLYIYDKIRDCKSTQDIKRLVDNKVYPIIKDLIDEYKPDNRDDQPMPSKLDRGTGYSPEENDRTATIPEDNEIGALLSPYIQTLARKLANILKENSAIRYHSGKRSGKLEARNAYRVLTNESRIFSRRTTPDKLKYKIQLILDASGSMVGDRQVNSYMAGYLLKEVAHKLNIPVEFIRYSGTVRTPCVDLAIYREGAYGGNSDADAVKKARLNLDAGANNIVMLITDGGVCQDPRDEIARLKRAGADFYAIGITSDPRDISEFNRYYKTPIICDKVEELPEHIIKIMLNQIHR